MKKFAVIIFALVTAVSQASPKIEVMPELAGMVNAKTADNAIPWYAQGGFDTLVSAQLDSLIPLVRTTHGDYNYTLYKVRFHSLKVLEGELNSKDLTFYLERPFPTPESGIKIKELWPFHKGRILRFKVKKIENKLQIVSIEMEPQQDGGGQPATRPETK